MSPLGRWILGRIELDSQGNWTFEFDARVDWFMLKSEPVAYPRDYVMRYAARLQEMSR